VDGSPEHEALIVALAVVPGVYSRNKFFGMYESADVKRARARASTIRSIVRQLVTASSNLEVLDLARGEGACVLRYRVRAMRYERKTVLTEVEASCVV
jgi:hypothetical protein